MEQGSWPEPRAWGARGFCCGLEGICLTTIYQQVFPHVLKPFSLHFCSLTLLPSRISFIRSLFSTAELPNLSRN
ncbi:hypothetical protein RchiOBHm_Chr4g0446561 [Rosa chinensis]|uniref:Uncharacterized protein n=1 Tax=Rosa chinensis TaxID=74649 RepID=A0A2P6R4R2_ROSCH|nr:hypothetical protein RchiOBHm_Chr4g0446561 [Rosa chinensis]